MKNRKKLPHNHLAEGEVTGHFHTAEGVTVFEELDGTRGFTAKKGGTAVTHQEHHTVIVPAGKQLAGRVREYDHFAEEARQVAD